MLKSARIEDRKKTSHYSTSHSTRDKEVEKPVEKIKTTDLNHATNTKADSPMEDQEHIEICELINEACSTAKNLKASGDASPSSQA